MAKAQKIEREKERDRHKEKAENYLNFYTLEQSKQKNLNQIPFAFVGFKALHEICM